MYVALSNGSSFAGPTVWGTTSPTDDYYVADLDGSHQSELITRNPATGVISAAIVNDQGSAWQQPQPIDTLPGNWRLYFADVTGNAAASIIGINPTTGQVNVAQPNDDGTYGSPTVWATVPTSGVDVAFADMDGSGRQDLVTRAQSGGGQVQVGFSDGGTAFSTPIAWGALSADHDFNALDLNGDFKSDVIGRNALGDISAELNQINTPLHEDNTSFTPDPGLIYDILDSPLITGILPPSGPFASIASGGARMKLSIQAPTPSGPLAAPGSPYIEPSPATPAATFDKAGADSALNRAKELGAGVVRLTVYWGAWTQNPTYKADVIAAVREVEAQGLRAYLTLTGADYDARIAGSRTSDFRIDSSGGYNGDPAINPITYAAWVGSVVATFKADHPAIFGYGIWNEPNDAGKPRHFITALCPGKDPAQLLARERINTADLYGQLYQLAFAQAKSSDHSSQIFFGELAGAAQSGVATCDGTSTIGGTLTKWLARSINDAPNGPVYAKGIAWHAYQHYGSPRSANGKQGTNTGYYGVGRINALQKAITDLVRTDKLAVVPHQAPSMRTVPGLYITEFGYLNLPEGGAPVANGSVHSESDRAALWKSALDWLNHPFRGGYAYKGPPLLLNAYSLVETGALGPVNSNAPNHMDFQATFDTGLIGKANQVTGTRPYGLGASDPFFVTHPQPRAAFCSIRNWASGHPGYSLLAPPPTDPDHC